MQTELQSLVWGERGGFARHFDKKRLSALILDVQKFSQDFQAYVKD